MTNLKYDQLLVSALNNKEKKLHTDAFSYRSIFLSSVVPDEENARFLPAILIEDEDAKLFVTRKLSRKQLIKQYDAENHVMIGKSCMVNCLKYGTIEWKKANETIESIMELGENISVSEMIQAPTVYPINDIKYRILTGHRRFFALIYAKGYGSAVQFKVYKSKPLLTKVKQFQENASREDLPQYGKLRAFLQAINEIDTLSAARVRVGLKRLTVKEIATNLGISMGAYDNYNVLTRYPCVVDAYESGLKLPFVRAKKIVLGCESDYKDKHEKSVLNVTDKKKISKEIITKLSGGKAEVLKDKPFKIKPIKSLKSLKILLTTNVLEIDCGIDWDSLDWNDRSQVSGYLAKLIELLESSSSLDS